MKLHQLPDDFTAEQFMQLDRESLNNIPYDRLKLPCQCKKCENGTHVRDYSIAPFYFLDRNSIRSNQQPADYWINLNLNFWLCGKHRLWFKKLEKRFEYWQVAQKLLDHSMMPTAKLILINKNVTGNPLQTRST